MIMDPKQEKDEFEEHRARIIKAQHAIQSAHAFDISRQFGEDGRPLITGGEAPRYMKNLRVGIDSVMRDHSSLAMLLIDKGIITEREYYDAIADGMEVEAEFAAAVVRHKYNLPDTVTFG